MAFGKESRNIRQYTITFLTSPLLIPKMFKLLVMLFLIKLFAQKDIFKAAWFPFFVETIYLKFYHMSYHHNKSFVRSHVDYGDIIYD